MQDNITIDTDPGIDDMFALLFSSCNQLPIRAVTTVYGNSTIDNVTKNAGYISKNIGAKWEIFKGADKPISGEARLAESHGQTGLGDVQLTDAQVKQPNHKTAQEFLTGLNVQDNNILLCIGPLTNLALALKNKPDFLESISKLIIMGGSFAEKGNVTEFAEFNVYNDPEAVALVIGTAYRQQVDTAIIPAEVCRKVLLTKQDLKALQNANLLPDLKAIVEPFIHYYMNDRTYGGYPGAVLYDVLVPIYYMYPQLFSAARSSVSIELDSVPQRGRTVALKDDNSPIKVCTDIDAVKTKELVMNSLMSSTPMHVLSQ
jgi:purine nucleosidase